MTDIADAPRAAVHGGVDALTADGGIVRIRPALPQDEPALRTMYASADPDNLRMRFFGLAGESTIMTEVRRLCRTPGPCHAAVVAELAGQVVGVASFERTSPADRRAEFAVFVGDAEHGRGIGTLLLEHLAAVARKEGVDELLGEVLPTNGSMIRVARDLSGRVFTRFADGVLDVGLPTVEDRDAVDARDRQSGHASLLPLLCPRSVAVIGAGRAPGGVGHETLRGLTESGYTGVVYAVNPHATEVAGVRAYPSLRTLPGPVDLVVVAVPASAVPGVIADAAVAGARAAVVLSAGFGEVGADGRQGQAALVDLARRHGIRLVGPNCIGILNTDAKVRLNASFVPGHPLPGGLAVASQSGAVGIALLDHATRSGCGISTFVSLGNKADVSGNDLISYWFDDPHTSAVALYLESFGNPRKFARFARALARRKPVLAVKSGRSAAGQRAGASHTAAAAAPDATVSALFAQAGVIRVDNIGELLDAARVLVDQPLPRGGRLAVLGNAGGFNVMAADAAAGGRLTVPAPTPELHDLLRHLAPQAATHDNPLDLGAAATPEAFASAARTLVDSGEVDLLLFVVAATRANDVSAILAALTPIVDAATDLAAAAVVVGLEAPPRVLGARRIPVFDLPEQAVRALDHAVRYADWRREPLGLQPDLPGIDFEAARATVEGALAVGGGWQPYPVAEQILRAYGIPLLNSTAVTDEDSAVGAARAAGYPVAVKSADPQLVHKTDVGGVHLHLTGEDDVRAAYRAVTAAGDPARGALVQPMAVAGVELVAGVVHDHLFGSVVMTGLGGVQTDLFDDRVLRLVPMTDLDARRMWRSLRAARLLTGFRGSRPVDTGALEDLLLRLGRLAEDLPEVAELDLNPVVARADGVVAVDAKLRLRTVDAEPDPVLRQLRLP
ncbi:Acyl-CoA synthetase (NDP forming) [Asanoa hainanensis]|uniref:Acyl-CoA synthetase (NDP forming) n=1 Tax=Asanoa hainanensis TaxID=560556 RepID=A0A239P125_9ACTN|nr:bifunctional GNAT family N-acetyltransferase/acetate--CoA ligase family protein [Asanoa hainanensis]SNT60837.1 Acyl-CoA synthetase (NDP forming) [Asanoa hainanensis]